jgi:hypothetical protein
MPYFFKAHNDEINTIDNACYGSLVSATMANWAASRGRLLSIAAAVVILLSCMLPSVAHADTDTLKWTATIQGKQVDPNGGGEPIDLGDTETMQVVLALENRGSTELRIRSVRLDGRVFGLKFFNFSSLIDVVLPAGGTVSRTVEFDVSDLRDQARGLIPGSLTLVAPDRSAIDSYPVPVDVRGSVISVYGVFGSVVAAITALLLVGLLLAIARRQLPRNRWRRALGFFTIGLGIAFTLTFSLSSARLLMPNPASWLTLLLGCGVTSFLLGYFLPLGRYVDSTDDSRAGSGLVSSRT